MSAEQQQADKLLGQILANRYLILHRLGEGAMGAVYKARHVKVGRSFAVKVLHPRLLADPKVAMRFEREAELAGRLRHANVVGVVDVGEVDDTRYMVMDFAEGPDLAQLLVEAPMPAERIIHLVRQMLEGLYHAHEQGLIHRDFKPENVIIERDTHGAEMPRIVDFGIAILRDAGEGIDGQGRLTTNGLVLGTPHYMAPEQAVADPIDHRIDLFALGIVIYEMLSGRLPFDGTGAEVARANLLLDPPPIAKRVPHLEVDPLLEAFARRLMAKRREARPPTAKAARELLDLIDRDRRAASTALGVPMSERIPAVTEPVSPQDRDSADLVAPGAPTARMKPTPLPSQPGTPLEPPGVIALPRFDALPASAVVFSPPRAPHAEIRRLASIPTPLSWETASLARSRRPWLIAGAILGATAIAAVVMIARAGDPDAPPRSDRVVMTPDPETTRALPTPANTDSQPDTPELEPRPAKARPDLGDLGDSRAADPTPLPKRPPALDARTRGNQRVETRPSDLQVANPRPIDVTAAPPAGSSADTRAASTAATGAKAADRRAVDPGPADDDTSKPVVSKPVVSKPAVIHPQAMAGITPPAISTLYYSIRPQLDQLPDDESKDLRERLRLFDIQALMVGPQADRDAAAPKLSQILNEALARQAATTSGAPSDKRKLRPGSTQPDR